MNLVHPDHNYVIDIIVVIIIVVIIVVLSYKCC